MVVKVYWCFDSNNKLCVYECVKPERHVIELKKKKRTNSVRQKDLLNR